MMRGTIVKLTQSLSHFSHFFQLCVLFSGLNVNMQNCPEGRVLTCCAGFVALLNNPVSDMSELNICYPLSDDAIGAGTLLTTGCRRRAFACSNWISLNCCCSRSRIASLAT